MASDFRFGTARSSVAFLFVRVGLSGADMGACAMLPRIVGLGRAAELLYTGRPLGGPEALSWGFYNRVCTPAALLDQARALAAELADGPFKAHATTKRMLHEEWAMGLDAAIEAETKTQAELMETNDFRRAYEAFTNKTAPKFQGD
jgi:enoyl-CoA hydratase/carnithine racemase